MHQTDWLANSDIYVVRVGVGLFVSGLDNFRRLIMTAVLSV